MREIKFRGISTGSTEFRYGCLETQDIHNGVSIRQGGCIVSKVDPETVGQYVGFQDATGKDIYEGDIFRQTIEDDHGDEYLYSIVTYIKEWGMFSILHHDEYINYADNGVGCLDEASFWTFTLEDINTQKVIGHIYQEKFKKELNH